MIKIGIYGATGYTGLELLRLLQRHPAAEIVWLTSENSAGQQFGDVFTVPPMIGKHALVASAAADLSAVDLVFRCLPHAVSLEPVAKARAARVKVIDLSADYRLKDPAIYEKTYNHAHTQRELLAQAVYGLPELHRAEIVGASLVVNPGCYPTSVILGLAPLAQAGWLAGTIISDSKSGVSGAGRSPSLKTHFVEANENVSPYNIGRVHWHLPEMEQELGEISKSANQQIRKWQIIFSPHLTPISRGMLSTIYVALPEGVSEAMCGRPMRRNMPPSRSSTCSSRGKSPRWGTRPTPTSAPSA